MISTIYTDASGLFSDENIGDVELPISCVAYMGK
jgi:hypothetical protein